MSDSEKVGAMSRGIAAAIVAEDVPAGSELTLGADGRLWIRRAATDPRHSITMVSLAAGTVVEIPLTTYIRWNGVRE